MGLRKFKTFFILLIFSMSGTFAEASWQGPETLISGGWGNMLAQFGIRYGDSDDTFPRDIIVLSKGDIWVPDGLVNERLKLYDNSGNLKKIISLDKTTRTFPEYWFIGKFEGVGLDGSVYMAHYMGRNEYAQYSPTGQLIKTTTTTRPLELGSASSLSVGSGQYKTTVKYPDIMYQFTSEQPIEKYYRDQNKNLYLVGSFTTIIEQAATEEEEDKSILTYQVDKYNQCSKKVSTLNLVPLQSQGVPLGAEYGEPIIAADGNIYTWKRTDSTYSILKWTWVDDPNVPTGPEPPSGLTLTPPINGLYLTWQASPNDPGCVTKYEIARSTTSGGVFSTIDTVEKGVLKYNETTASAGTTYYYKIRAVAGTAYSPYTKEVSGKR